jgi:hypothetical protein
VVELKRDTQQGPLCAYAEIRLHDGQVTKVDSDVWYEFSQHRWRFLSHGRYAVRTKRLPERKVLNIFMHRVIMEPIPPGMVIDHINGDGLDNRRSNLRICTQAQNTANQKRKSNATCKYRGVCVTERGIKAHIKKKTIGWFDTLEDAARAYDAWARQWFGEYARLNFPDEVHEIPPHVCKMHRWLGKDFCKNCGEKRVRGYFPSEHVR